MRPVVRCIGYFACTWAFLLPIVSHAQEFDLRASDRARREAGFRFEGMHFEVGAVDPQIGDGGFVLGATAHLGTRFASWLDFAAGARYWSIDIERETGTGPIDGSLQDVALHTSLSFAPVKIRGTRPYVLGGIAAHFVGADIGEDPVYEDALAGFQLGADAAFGIATVRPGVGVRLEARRSFVENVGHWAYTIGVGWWPGERARPSRRMPRTTVRPSADSSWLVPSQTVQPRPTDTQTAQATDTTHAMQDTLMSAIAAIRSENLALRGTMDSLRAELDRDATRRKLQPDTAPVDAIEKDKGSASDRPQQLREALQRLVSMSGGALVLVEQGHALRVRFSSGGIFESGSARLQTTAVEQLRRFSVALFRFPELIAMVEGHTDATGTDARNLEISQQRAEAVRAELIAIGIEAERLQAVGHGSSRPIADNATVDGRNLNRRVEILIVDSETGSLRR